MSWSYDNTDLDTATASGRLNVVRFLVGDTDTNDQQVQDQEITFSLSETNSNVYSAASYIARTISSKYARLVDVNLDGQAEEKLSNLSNQYATLADRLEAQSKKINARLGFNAGGLTETGVEAVRADTNRIKPSFRRDRFWNPPNYDGSNDYEDV